jgi:hypothetical protein
VVVPWTCDFNSTVLRYHLVRDFPESRERVRVVITDQIRGASYTRNWLIGDYVVYGPQLVTGNKILAALTRFLESPPAVFADAHQKVASFPLPGGWTAKLIKRIKPLTFEEAALSIVALNIPKEGKSAMLRDAQAWLEKRGD